ncbi:MAG: hypothetical protein GY811_00275 [Myxococcales bacterium]|nr:hypothetical protein [Myxococcales bacterium]
MFRAQLPKLVTCSLAVLALTAGASSLLDAQPTPAIDAGPSGAGPSDAFAATDAGGPQMDAAPTSDPLPSVPTFDAQLATTLRSRTGNLTLIGRSGQLYESTGDLEWQRTDTGGVSATVTAMYRSGSGKLYAVGARAPLFARKDGLWAAYPLARKGSSAASTGQRPIIALRHQLYELGTTGWRALTLAPAVVKHLWAASPTRIFLADRDGQLWSGRGAGWQRISVTLAPGEGIASLHGVPGKLAVALTTQGRLFSLGKRVARPIRSGSLGGELRIQTVGVVGGVLLAAAQLAERSLLLEVEAKTMKRLDDLWPLSEGDRFAIVAEHPSGILVATERGQARIGKQDHTWRNATVKAEFHGAPETFPNSGPARAR